MTIKTERLSATLRSKAVDLVGKRLLITNFYGTQQEADFSEPANCAGLGRIRHFNRTASGDWLPNPLPIDPALKALRLPHTNELRAQVFQTSACNWRCWYCYVPFKLLAAQESTARWVSARELVDLYLSESSAPAVIDLTGGQPDLVPEWIPWMMRELIDRGLQDKVYLWSDDNLSNDYFWRYLTDEDRSLVANYPTYGRVGCFKGFNSESFTFNTGAPPDEFEQQFDLFQRLLSLGIDLYAYVTFTAPRLTAIHDSMCRFVDRLQAIHPYLPLRVVPLEIRLFTPVNDRLNQGRVDAFNNQHLALEHWRMVLLDRFSPEQLTRPITEVSLTHT